MVGLYVEGHAHLAQTSRDLDGIAMGMRNGAIEIIIFIALFVEVHWVRDNEIKMCSTLLGLARCQGRC